MNRRHTLGDLCCIPKRVCFLILIVFLMFLISVYLFEFAVCVFYPPCVLLNVCFLILGVPFAFIRYQCVALKSQCMFSNVLIDYLCVFLFEVFISQWVYSVCIFMFVRKRV